MNFASRLAEGQVLGGRYRIVRRIGSGGMSQVYLAEDMRLPGQRWAVKESLSLPGSATTVAAEAELLISLNHRLLPRVADFFPPDGQGCCYLVMDYIEGMTLAEYMKENPGPLAAGRIISCASQLLEVLQYLHGHRPPVIYRDLKPGNIMLTGSGELKLIDFGIARSFRTGAGEDTEKLGTAGFAAPEQYGGGQSGPAADMYGLGALLLYMASGGMFSRWEPGMEAKLPGLPERLIPVIRRLLRYHPEERFQCAEDVLEALQPLIELPGKSRLAEGVHPDVPSRHRPVVIAALGVAAGLGTTHTSLAVSSCLARKGETAWIGLSPDSLVFDRIRSLLDNPPESAETAAAEMPLSWRGIDFWRCSAQDGLNKLYEKNYDYIVADLGTGGYDGALEAFADSDIPLLLASGADWRLEDTLHWLRRSGLTPLTEICIGLPLASRSAAALLTSVLGGEIQVYSLPLQVNPFQRSGKLIGMLDQLLDGTGKLAVSAKRKRWFQKKN
ncbi:Serine/threonine-protein kinase StkP [compost metagenome]